MASILFKKIDHSAMDVIWPYLKREMGQTTDFSYGGILMWVDLFKYEYAIVEDTLFIKGVVENHRELPAFSMPVGSLSLERSVDILKEYCNQKGIRLEFSAVPEYALEDFNKLLPKQTELLEHWSDYLYDADMLASLKGKKMSKKRNHVNQFITRYPEWQYKPLDSSNIDDVLKFMDTYDTEVDDTFMAHEESMLSRKIMKIIAEGDPVLKGGVLYCNPNEICAVSIGDVKGDTLFVHIEKALREIAGSYEMINKEFAHYIIENYQGIKFINREDDGGDDGLRLAKESYHPVALLKKYNIIF